MKRPSGRAVSSLFNGGSGVLEQLRQSGGECRPLADLRQLIGSWGCGPIWEMCGHVKWLIGEYKLSINWNGKWDGANSGRDGLLQMRFKIFRMITSGGVVLTRPKSWEINLVGKGANTVLGDSIRPAQCALVESSFVFETSPRGCRSVACENVIRDKISRDRNKYDGTSQRGFWCLWVMGKVEEYQLSQTKKADVWRQFYAKNLFLQKVMFESGSEERMALWNFDGEFEFELARTLGKKEEQSWSDCDTYPGCGVRKFFKLSKKTIGKLPGSHVQTSLPSSFLNSKSLYGDEELNMVATEGASLEVEGKAFRKVTPKGMMLRHAMEN